MVSKTLFETTKSGTKSGYDSHTRAHRNCCRSSLTNRWATSIDRLGASNANICFDLFRSRRSYGSSYIHTSQSSQSTRHVHSARFDAMRVCVGAPLLATLGATKLFMIGVGCVPPLYPARPSTSLGTLRHSVSDRSIDGSIVLVVCLLIVLPVIVVCSLVGCARAQCDRMRDAKELCDDGRCRRAERPRTPNSIRSLEQRALELCVQTQ